MPPFILALMGCRPLVSPLVMAAAAPLREQSSRCGGHNGLTTFRRHIRYRSLRTAPAIAAPDEVPCYQ